MMDNRELIDILKTVNETKTTDYINCLNQPVHLEEYYENNILVRSVFIIDNKIKNTCYIDAGSTVQIYKCILNPTFFELAIHYIKRALKISAVEQYEYTTIDWG